MLLHYATHSENILEIRSSTTYLLFLSIHLSISRTKENKTKTKLKIQNNKINKYNILTTYTQ